MGKDYNCTGKELLAESCARRAKISHLFRQFCGPFVLLPMDMVTQLGKDTFGVSEIIQSKIPLSPGRRRIPAGRRTVSDCVGPGRVLC